jgi:hypothetical protein
MHMPGKLRKGARCWKCGGPVIAVMRHWSPSHNRADLTFVHVGGKQCEVRTTFKRSERAMEGLPRT